MNYRFRVTEGYSDAIFRENGIPISTVNHNDSINKIYAITGISLENSVYYIYIYFISIILMENWYLHHQILIA